MNDSPQDSVNALTSWFSGGDFMPHGQCYLWQKPLIWTHFTSDLLIGLAYVAISILLYGLVKKIRLPFSGMFLAFGAFIGFCGMTHFMEVWTLWNADYWASGMVKIVTAAASVATGVLLVPVAPRVEALAHAAKLSEQRKIQLESAHKELEILYSKVKESDALKTQFFANVSHELRTPLALILGPVEQLLSRGKLDEQDRRAAEVVLRNSKTLLKQVNDLLDIAKLEAGRLRPNYARVDLVKLIRVTVAHFETVMQSKGVFFSLQTPDSLDIEADPDKIQRVFMNLLSNAVKFTPDGGRIRVSVQSPNGIVAVSVADTGPGVKPELHEAIFERFRQGEGGINRQFGGTGLGLAIVKDFVEMHGGRVQILRNHSPGATFVVEIPKKAPTGTEVLRKLETIEINEVLIQGAVAELRREPEHPSPESQAAGKPAALVCEDNPDMNRFVAETLVPDFNVITALDGRDGLEKAIALRPDLVVSDIMMPYMGGDELLHAIREHEEIADTPVLLLSARADDDLRVKLLREGASDYVVKPFKPEELRARALNLLILKKTRDILEQELSTKSRDLVGMAQQLAVQKREAQLARDTAEIARAQAEKASQVRSTFLSLVSHELNTPLTSQHLTLQMLTSRNADNLTDQQKRMLDRLLGASRQLKSLVESLLEYTRVESGRLPIVPQPIEMDALIRQLAEETQPLAQSKGLDLRFQVPSGLAPLTSDPKLIRVVLSNLVMNAIKFTDSGSVNVSVERADGRHVIRVTDTGPGIAPEDQARVFDPFLQLEPLAQKSTAGVGLGLALVRQIVGALGGEIRLESEIGKGSTFVVSLPPLEQATTF